MNSYQRLATNFRIFHINYGKQVLTKKCQPILLISLYLLLSEHTYLPTFNAINLGNLFTNRLHVTIYSKSIVSMMHHFVLFVHIGGFPFRCAAVVVQLRRLSRNGARLGADGTMRRGGCTFSQLARQSAVDAAGRQPWSRFQSRPCQAGGVARARTRHPQKERPPRASASLRQLTCLTTTRKRGGTF